jgi:hypothetical protein
MVMNDTAEATGDDRDGLEIAVDRLLADSEGVRVAVSALESAGDEATDEYVAEVEEALATMELDLQIARAALAVRTAEEPGAIETRLSELSDVIRGWTEELAVRGRLGSMEVSDRFEEFSRRLERASSVSRSALERLREDLGEDLDGLRASALAALRDTRAALANSAASLRRTD